MIGGEYSESLPRTWQRTSKALLGSFWKSATKRTAGDEGSMSENLRTYRMPNNKSSNRNLASLYLMPSEDDALRTSFAAIAEPCDRQPPIYYSARHGVRSPWRVLMRCFKDAFDAAQSHAARRAVVERVCLFLDDCASNVRLWLWTDSPHGRRELFESAQDADGQEDMAETIFLLEPSRPNAERLIEASRLERQRSEEREHHLLQIVRGDLGPRPAA